MPKPTIPTDIDDMVEIDRLNMSPAIEASGGIFDSAIRKQSLVEELNQGAATISVKRGGSVVAYIEYWPHKGPSWNLASVQIHPNHRDPGMFRKLAGEAWARLKKEVPVTIQSSVHMGNTNSLALHARLGFEEYGRDGDRILFRFDGQHIRNRLSRFLPKKRP